jgi:membrane protease YdiL (CAAX protease family)
MKNQLLLFFSLAYFISWITWAPLYFSVLGSEAFVFQHGLGALGPCIAALICTLVFDGKKGIKNFLLALVSFSKLVLLIVAVFAPFLLSILALVINFFQSGVMGDFSKIGLTKEFPGFNVLTFFIYNLIFFGFGEEAGWRGFALPRLQSRFNALNSSLLLTVFWAIWHWPLFFYRPGYMSMDFAGILGWFFSLLTGSVLLTWLFNSSRGSILVCAIFHSTIDVAFTSDYLDKKIVGLMGMLITLWGIAFIFIFKSKNLSKEPRQRYVADEDKFLILK